MTYITEYLDFMLGKDRQIFSSIEDLSILFSESCLDRNEAQDGVISGSCSYYIRNKLYPLILQAKACFTARDFLAVLKN